MTWVETTTVAPLSVRFTLAGSSAMHPGDYTMVIMNPNGTEGAKIGSPVSVVFDQAENRLHTQKALLLMLLA